MKNKFLLSILFLFLALPAFCAQAEDPAIYYNKGIDLYEQNKIEESIASFKKALSIDPEFYEAWYNLARVQESIGKTQDAFNSYEALLKVSPDDYESVLQYGELLYKKGYLSKASSYLKKIPATSEYKKDADKLLTTIAQRQIQLEEEAKAKLKQTQSAPQVIANIPAPSGLVIDSEGNMFVASFTESKIIKITDGGNTKLVFVDKGKNIDGPIGLAIDSNDNLYIANYNKGNVVLISKNGSSRILTSIKKPYCINLDEKAGKIYITEQQNNSVVSYDIKDILQDEDNKKEEIPAASEVKQGTTKVIVSPATDNAKLGVPSIIDAGFTRVNPSSRITAPIMVPSTSDDIFAL